MIQMPEVNSALCDGCGLCLTVCQGEALVMIQGTVTVIQGATCDYCALCELVCPSGAIGCPYEIVVDKG